MKNNLNDPEYRWYHKEEMSKKVEICKTIVKTMRGNF